MSKCVLVIMDGFGMAPAGGGNAISLAKKPNLDRIFAENAHTELSASGRLAWTEWNHPNMPWTYSQLRVASLTFEGAIDREATPRPVRTRASSGSPPASPHTPMGFPVARPPLQA